ncbi:hypothetical protein [Streptomyces sp. NBC_01373]|uniref:hypothetical protein n=1 Tax=unclassified Streptomyces TaxID=2593676 RepID=UPI0022573166|nr:hypothetical protein [Streptomyces sp. NBC_01373]MCX4702751.1 hypothetical protein [Streptomyces sp. NBC_01373]
MEACVVQVRNDQKVDDTTADPTIDELDVVVSVFVAPGSSSTSPAFTIFRIP